MRESRRGRRNWRGFIGEAGHRFSSEKIIGVNIFNSLNTQFILIGTLQRTNGKSKKSGGKPGKATDRF